MRLIDADALYEKTAEWEAQALHMAEVTMHDEDKTEWRRWSAILTERSAFKFDVADTPTIEPPTTTWLGNYCPYTCQHCGKHTDSKTPFCAWCGRRAVNYDG